jgi:hypothetical protein
MEIKATVQFYIWIEIETLNFRDVKCKAECSGKLGPLKHCLKIPAVEVKAEPEAEWWNTSQCNGLWRLSDATVCTLADCAHVSAERGVSIFRIGKIIFRVKRMFVYLNILQQVFPKRWYLRTALHGIMFRNTVVFTATVMTSNLTGFRKPQSLQAAKARILL